MMFLIFFALAGTATVLAQGVGKPKRIKFTADRSSTTLTGTLSKDEEMEYEFDARKGQQVTIRNTRPSLFDFRVVGNGDIAFDTEFDSSATSTFDLPETGNYTFVVRKKRVKTPRTARFSVTLSIK